MERAQRLKNSRPMVLAKTAMSHGNKTASEIKGCISKRVFSASFSRAVATDCGMSDGHKASTTPAATTNSTEQITRLRKAAGDMIANVKWDT